MSQAIKLANTFFGIEEEKVNQPMKINFVYTDEMFFENCKKSIVDIRDTKKFTKDYMKAYMLLLTK